MKYLIIAIALFCVTGCATIQDGVGKKVDLTEAEAKIPIYGINAGVIKNKVQGDIIGDLQSLDKYIELSDYIFLKQNSLKDVNGKKILAKARKLAFSKDTDGIMVTELYEKRMDIIPGITGLGWHLKGYAFKYSKADVDLLKHQSTLVSNGNKFKIVSAYQAIISMDYAIKNKTIGLYSIAGTELTRYTRTKRNSKQPYINSLYRLLATRYIHYLKVMAPIYIRSGKINEVKTELRVLEAKESKTAEEIDLVNYLSEIIIRGS